MNRMGYGLEEIAQYREQVKEYWVPAVRQIKELQRKRLGLSELKGYDNLLYFPDYNPVPKGDSREMLDACRQMFHGLSKETGEFFDSLLERDMFDLDSRAGKAPGGCASDEFLTVVYQNPDMDAAGRHALWKQLRETYEPHFADFDDLPLYGKGQECLIDPQLFLCPFYLVDYGLARNIALQLFMLQRKDPEKAWEKYMKFLSFGGTKTYIEAVRAIGMEVPFEGEAIRHVIEPMLIWVQEQNKKIGC